MLDNETKRRIDTARDILVGKVPDPKSQVEQITIALIYKFMDDMDTQAEELGGKREFFAGDFIRYGWSKLMSASMGGHELIGLYGEGISSMTQNSSIPPLFRNIFKNAYLPYRDPETLKSFLKVINEFSYNDSESLGDAFEYLLSVLGSQGDAGQFRTPRHIIDFIVDIIAPKKNEVILDPACGTSGFLISSYKYILDKNLDAKNISTLTPTEKGCLAKNFKGYDISPDMVRLSLVNMYLHGFSDPHIFEYDTLTSEERWNEFADVIIANPPFMSPKGGIKPHKRFSIQAKRSEVLFVDYIAEHLTPTGRAGIIVPEGIIFQSQTAYKELRKMLVENSLVAVISLPAGVFNPYSGVKTSILILDKSLAKNSNTIAFFKIENDGFSLGAQRRANAGGQLAQVTLELKKYLQAVRNQQSTNNLQSELGLIVAKEKIAANSNYNLSKDRYGERVASISTFPLVRLEDVFTKISNGVNVTQMDEQARYQVSRIQTIANGSVNLKKTKFTNDEVKPESFLKPGDILLSHINSFDHLGKSAIFLEKDNNVVHGTNLIRLIPNISRIDSYYAIRIFKTDRFINTVKSFAQKAVNQASVKISDLRSIQIPLPPLEVQKQIVAEIEGYQKIINGARAVIDTYRPHISIHPDWPIVKLGELCKKIQYGLSISMNTEKSGFKIFRMNELIEGKCVDEGNMKHAEISPDEFEKYRLTCGNILFNRTNSFEHVGRTGIFDLEGDYCFASYLIRLIIDDEKADPYFINAFMNSDSFQQGIKQFASQAIGQSNINAKSLASYPIPLPPIIMQKTIAAEIKAEKLLVAANRELIARFEKKIQTTLARVWGEHE
ncbi:MAG: methylase [Gammaproteobacteria bacterium]|jgi:type I restriction enzyme M protein|nr:methylase [Gammaproteobacteria bacterium]